jgi:hypothetical protein
MFFGIIEDELGFTLLNPEELVNLFMHLVATSEMSMKELWMTVWTTTATARLTSATKTSRTIVALAEQIMDSPALQMPRVQVAPAAE